MTHRLRTLLVCTAAVIVSLATLTTSAHGSGWVPIPDRTAFRSP